MKLTTSPAGLALIQQFESFSPDVYLCPAGKRTIGYGHVVRSADNLTPPVTHAEALALLAQDCSIVEIYLNATLPGLTQCQFDALASFAFNVGLGAFEKSTMFKKLKSGDMASASAEFQRWIFAAGKPLAGLARRRQAERALFLQENSHA